MSEPTRELPAKAQPPATAAPPSPLRNAIAGTIAVLVLLAAGWYLYQQMFPAEYSFGIPDDERLTNHDTISADQLLDLPLFDSAGEPVSLRDRLGKKHLVIVVTRGSLRSAAWNKQKPQLPEFPNVCAYCSSQASGIASVLDAFEKQDAEVLLVFPVQQKVEFADADTLRRAGTNPSTKKSPTLLVDVDCAAAEKLKIRDHLARPSSFIIDKDGQLRFAYVSQKGWVDRPSGKELLRHVTQVNADFQPSASP